MGNYFGASFNRRLGELCLAILESKLAVQDVRGKLLLLLERAREVGDDEGAPLRLLGGAFLRHRGEHVRDADAVRLEDLVATPLGLTMRGDDHVSELLRALAVVAVRRVVEIGLANCDGPIGTHLERRARLVLAVVPPPMPLER